ncbi:MAG: hypothetical protein ACOCX5_04255 [Chloroflexota bacterium]
MASKNQTKTFNIRHALLIGYFGVCVGMVVITLGLAFIESNAVAVDPTPVPTVTRSPMVMTLQAEDYAPVDAEAQQSLQDNGGGMGTQVPEMTREPELTPRS